MPAPTMEADAEWYEDEEEETKWDWWPALSHNGAPADETAPSLGLFFFLGVNECYGLEGKGNEGGEAE
eukprot:2163796-Amphidinium_carterae.1